MPNPLRTLILCDILKGFERDNFDFLDLGVLLTMPGLAFELGMWPGMMPSPPDADTGPVWGEGHSAFLGFLVLESGLRIWRGDIGQ